MSTVSNNIYKKTSGLICNYLKLEPNEIYPDVNLSDDLEIDSLALIEIAFQIAETFSIEMPTADPHNLIFKNLVAYIEKSVNNS